jgi:hypothetical protein
MPDDLTIEVTGSAEKAASALDKIIQKISDLQAKFDAAAPSVSKFADRMNEIASSSKAFSAFQKMAVGMDKTVLSAKNAESRMAMYQARLDRANASMERSRVQSDKLAASQRKLAEVQSMVASNSAAFSMPADKFAEKFNMNNGNSGTNYTPESPADTYVPPVTSAGTKPPMEQFFGSSPKTQSIRFDTSQAQSAVERLGNWIDGLNPQIAHMSSEAQSRFNELSAQLMRTGQQIDNLSAIYHRLSVRSGEVAAKSGESSTAYLQLEKRMLANASASDRLGSKQEKLKAKMSEIASASNRASMGLSGLGRSAESASQRSSRGFSNLLKVFSRMAAYMVVFQAYRVLAQGIVTGIQNMSLANVQANSTMSALATNSLYLQNSIAAALMPALQALVPTINQVTDALANVFNTIGMLTARIFNHASTVTIAKRANVDYAATLDKTKKSADAAKKSLMGFDELNILNEQKANEGVTSPGMPSYDAMFETVKVPDWVEWVGQITDKIQNLIKTNIDTITRLLRLAPLVVGAILAFSGANVPLGIGLMAVGAVLMAKQAKEDWDYLTNKTNSSLDKTKRILQIVGAVELALGAILAFSGANVPLGIGLMIGGITTTAATLNWDSMGEQLKTTIGKISFAAGDAMLVIGSLLTFSGANVPLGIGLMIGGATTLAAAAVVNWNAMNNQLKDTIGKIAIAVGAELLVLGAVLTFSGANLPAGIGLMAVGAAHLAVAAVLNWDSVKGSVQHVLTEITKMLGISLLPIGAALAFSGANIPLGIGLMAAGAVSLAASAALNWDSVKNQVKTVLTDILAIASASSVAIGLILCLTGAGIPLGVGLIIAGLAGSKLAKVISTDPITNWAQNLVDRIVGVFSKGVDAITKKYKEAGKGLGGSGFEGGGGGFGGGSGGIRDAAGTAFHPGGPALVNDQLGPIYQELVHLPNGLSFIPSGRNVLIPDLPRGSSVLNAAETQKLFPHYAEGSGSLLARPILDQNGRSESNTDVLARMDGISERLEKLEKAILAQPVKLYADSREIARAANDGNRILERRQHPIAST